MTREKRRGVGEWSPRKRIGGEGEARGDGSAAEWGKTAFFSTFVCQIM